MHVFGSCAVVIEMSKSILKKTLALDLDLKTISGSKNKGKNGVQKKSKKRKRSLNSKIERQSKNDAESLVEKNLQFIEKLKSFSTPAEFVNKIVEHQTGRLAKSRPSPKKKEEEKTVFTEDDFLKFEQEYFVQGKI